MERDDRIPARRARELIVPSTPSKYLIDSQGIRELAGGIPRTTLLRWRDRMGFPKPLPTPHLAAPVWDRRDVTRWLEDHGKR